MGLPICSISHFNSLSKSSKAIVLIFEHLEKMRTFTTIFTWNFEIDIFSLEKIMTCICMYQCRRKVFLLHQKTILFIILFFILLPSSLCSSSPKSTMKVVYEISLFFYFFVLMNSIVLATTQILTPNVTVAQDGSGDYTTITQAIDASPTFLTSSSRFIIYVKRGVYHEHVYIPFNRTHLALVGDGMRYTKIIGDRSNATGYGTVDTATVGVDGHGFMARDIAFINSAGPRGAQAVALRSHSNLSVFYRCSIEGYQDSLFVQSFLQFYRECNVYGTIDFIFGTSSAVFQNCNIYGRKPLLGQALTITADGRKVQDQVAGIVFHNCSIRATKELEAVKTSVQSYFGRPWRPYSRTIIIQSYIEDFIDPKGWTTWTGKGVLSTSYYAEYGNRGPGSKTSGRMRCPGVKILKNPSDVVNFTVDKFIVGSEWLPMTGVPYTPGLI